MVHRRVRAVPKLEHRVVAEDLIELLDRGKAAPGRQQGAPGIDAVLGKPGVDLFPEAAGAAVVIAAGDNRGIVRQVVKQGGALLEKQWQVIFTSPGTAPGADFTVHRALVVIDIEGFVPVHLEAAHRAPVQGILPGRQQVDRLHLVHRPLGFRVKGAQRVHLGVQQVDAVRQLAAHRENVEQRAAQGKFTVLKHGFHIEVAVAQEVAPELVDIQRLAGLQYQAGSGHVIGGRKPVHQGRDRHHQDAGTHATQAVQRAQPLGDDILVR